MQFITFYQCLFVWQQHACLFGALFFHIVYVTVQLPSVACIYCPILVFVPSRVATF